MASLVKYGASLGKLGLLGGAVGVTTHYGVWGDTQQGVNAYKNMQDVMEPYVQSQEQISQVKSMTSSALTSSSGIDIISKTKSVFSVDTYNKGVQKTFEFVGDAPGMVSESLNSLTKTVKKQLKD
ncbi:uncharacterized protein LOC110463421 [Mizuhopecten yessoensis]|uniref:uncharacterized protein LOC110463421 n=1 Tax=Mizuhopecten yessoensis TaxID=6573 RepID=UPI000B457D35|nr:uncharacterized protein LOC110463421 [Mizuhopecten yessoensis]